MQTQSPSLSRDRWLFGLLVVLGLYGFFGLRLDDANRILAALWNLSHILFFLLLGVFAFKLFRGLRHIGLWPLLLWMCATSAMLGLLIEVLQSQIGRSMSLRDILFDVLGAALAVSFFSPQRRRLVPAQTWLLQGISLILLLLAVSTLFPLLLDEYYQRQRFPVLSDFSTPYELTRWDGRHADLQVHASGAARSLRVRFQPAEYPAVQFEHFRSDWHRYETLVIELANPARHSLLLTVRIHDRAHKLHGNAHQDRFNRSIELAPGQRQIRIRLADIAAAPASRRMDMTQIENLALFLFDTRREYILDIHRLYLE